jgi:adenine C2-methylase RlmN of 23S rRNA A2503 and tRNA A37
MAPKRNTKLLSIWDEAAVAPIFSSNKAKLKHAIKMWKWMYSNLDCDDVLNVPMDLWHTPKKSAEELKSRFHYFTTKIVEENVSSRGDTIKLVIELQDGHKIETVIMKHPDYSTVW